MEVIEVFTGKEPLIKSYLHLSLNVIETFKGTHYTSECITSSGHKFVFRECFDEFMKRVRKVSSPDPNRKNEAPHIIHSECCRETGALSLFAKEKVVLMEGNCDFTTLHMVSGQVHNLPNTPIDVFIKRFFPLYYETPPVRKNHDY